MKLEHRLHSARDLDYGAIDRHARMLLRNVQHYATHDQGVPHGNAVRVHAVVERHLCNDLNYFLTALYQKLGHGHVSDLVRDPAKPSQPQPSNGLDSRSYPQSWVRLDLGNGMHVSLALPDIAAARVMKEALRHHGVKARVDAETHSLEFSGTLEDCYAALKKAVHFFEHCLGALLQEDREMTPLEQHRSALMEAVSRRYRKIREHLGRQQWRHMMEVTENRYGSH